MKRILSAFAVCLVALALGACSTAQQSTATGDLAKLQTVVANGCLVAQPTLVAVAALDPTVAAAATANGLFCATAGAITVTSIQSLVSTGIPAIEQAITSSTLVPADQKLIIIAAIGVFQLTVTNALAVYGNVTPTAAPVAASTPLASAPLQ